jgi:NAD(P)-dependent dehydrogenase (short-subunit alcohol dehydrogenase family)
MTETFRPPQGPCFADLRGKAALVTGGGAGISRGITGRLAAEGMDVFLCGRTEAKLQETAERIQQAGGWAVAVVADVSREEDIARLFARIREERQTLDVLVHNAALIDRGTLQKTDAAFWHTMYATNIHSAFYLAKQCAEMMVPRRSGNMIFISTIGATRPHQGMLAYDSSKGALDTFTRSLAIELAPLGIRVNAIAPGAIAGREPRGAPDSPWARHSKLAFEPEINLEDFAQKYVPVGRFGMPAEIAAAVAFLASDQASYITGHVLCVDGGATAQLSPRGIWI